jgi:hypothetical protein
MHVSKLRLFALSAAAVLLTSCAKEALEAAQEQGVASSSCGQPGARLQASFSGGAYCASGNITAIGDSASVIVTGFDLMGRTLMIQFDSLAPGTQSITAAHNGILFMSTGNSYTIHPQHPGTLTITAFDAANRRLKASFSAQLMNEMSGHSLNAQGEVDVTYTVQE